MKKKTEKAPPEIEELREELGRVHRRHRLRAMVRRTFYTLTAVAAMAVLAAILWLPALQIYGHSMTPTLQNGEIVFSVKTSDLDPGDIVSFHYNNKILVKRVIARPGEWVDIDREGNVFVNGKLLDESYLEEKAFGDCSVELPCQVPDGKVFVMGDHRSTSVDSRNADMGCIAQEQIVGKIIFRVWPLNRLGAVE